VVSICGILSLLLEDVLLEGILVFYIYFIFSFYFKFSNKEIPFYFHALN
jgi:hypothetical protein